jgi:hypothetical protein
VVVNDTTLLGGGDGNIIFCLKVPRQCPQVLLIRVRFVIEVGGAALEWNLGLRLTEPPRIQLTALTTQPSIISPSLTGLASSSHEFMDQTASCRL